MKQTAVEWLIEQLENHNGVTRKEFENVIQEALEIERMQIFKSKNISAREAYKAGQRSMYCGCYEIDGCTNYEEWLYEKFKS
jgi:hypothetical protein